MRISSTNNSLYTYPIWVRWANYNGPKFDTMYCCSSLQCISWSDLLLLLLLPPLFLLVTKICLLKAVGSIMLYAAAAVATCLQDSPFRKHPRRWLYLCLCLCLCLSLCLSLCRIHKETCLNSKLSSYITTPALLANCSTLVRTSLRRLSVARHTGCLNLAERSVRSCSHLQTYQLPVTLSVVDGRPRRQRPFFN